MTQLRDRMLEELERRNYAPGTARAYLFAVKQFAEHFHRAPDRLGAEHIREYQLYLFRERKLAAKTGAQRVAALRFFYVKTLKRHHMLEPLPFPRLPEKLPTVLSREEVGGLLAASANRLHRTMLMTLYSTGVRRTELCRLKTSDIDSQRMVVHVRQGKGRRDRDVPLSPALLEELRGYWRWMKPKTFLFPGLVDGWRADVPISDKAHLPAHPAPQLRDPPARSRSGPAHHSGAARPCLARSHHRLSPPLPAAYGCGPQPARYSCDHSHCSEPQRREAQETMSRPTLEVADIIRTAGNRFWEKYGSHLAWPHRKVLDAIVRCRTAALGGHLDQCVRCGHQAVSYNSCRNRHCPRCQGPALPQVPGQRACQVAGRAFGGAFARALLPHRLHPAPRVLRSPPPEQAPAL